MMSIQSLQCLTLSNPETENCSPGLGAVWEHSILLVFLEYFEVWKLLLIFTETASLTAPCPL